MRLHAIGYWFNAQAPSTYPLPQRLVGRWPAAERRAVLAHLRAGEAFETYEAYSHCRFGCGIPARRMGRRDLTDGTWLWPDGLAHYVEAHGVRLPPRFVRHVLGPPERAWRIPEEHRGLVTDARWLGWARGEGASLDLARWLAPDAALAARLEAHRHGPLVAAFGRVRARCVLVRQRRPYEQLFLAGDGRLAVFAPDQPRPRILPGWEAWPAWAA
jgi:hypothetical protein